jgi:cell division transport system ATP-binding protein
MIRLDSVTKRYPTGNTALSDISFNIEQGEFVFFVGPSGSGKTTLLRMLIRDVLPTTGSIHIGNWDIVGLPRKNVPHLRKKIGVVFQDLKLLKDRTIYENILFPLEVGNVEGGEAKKRVEEILSQVGIVEHKDKFPIQLSGGEMQRAAIARALAFSPEIILADEPTGNLDNATSWEIVKLLQDINNTGTTIIMATHNTDIVNTLLKRVITLEKGKLVRDVASASNVAHTNAIKKEKHTAHTDEAKHK